MNGDQASPGPPAAPVPSSGDFLVSAPLAHSSLHRGWQDQMEQDRWTFVEHKHRTKWPSVNERSQKKQLFYRNKELQTNTPLACDLK